MRKCRKRRETGFMIQQPFFVRKATAVARERAIGADHPVTGHNNRNGIRSVGSADGAACSLATNFPGEFAITYRCTGRNLPQGTPYFALKRRATRRGPYLCQ